MTVCMPCLPLQAHGITYPCQWLKGCDMSKSEKYKAWDRIFGFGPDNWKFEEWKPKHGSWYFMADCRCQQISDPDLPF